MTDDERLARILTMLRERGGRVTDARRAIVTALLDAPEHVTAEDLAATVTARLPEVHVSTVYRTLERLRELGIVDHVHLGHGSAVYHLADDTHHHLVCGRCGQVVEIPGDLLEDLVQRVFTQYGFELDAGHFAFGGSCDSCRPPT